MRPLLNSGNRALVELLDKAGGVDLESLCVVLGLKPAGLWQRLSRLRSAGHVESMSPSPRMPALWIPTALGLRESIGREDVRPPSLSLGSYPHQLAAGRVAALLEAGGLRWESERSVRRSHADAAREGDVEGARRYSLSLRGLRTRHLPDLLVWSDPAQDGPLAIEVELASKTQARLRDILGGYALDLDITGVLYLAGGPYPDRVLNAITTANRDAGARLHAKLLDEATPEWVSGWLGVGRLQRQLTEDGAGQPAQLGIY